MYPLLGGLRTIRAASFRLADFADDLSVRTTVVVFGFHLVSPTR
jgi:hypothetical protein